MTDPTHIAMTPAQYLALRDIARPIPFAELARRENAAMHRAWRCPIPNKQSITKREAKAQASERAAAKAKADQAMHDRIHRAIAKQAMTMGEVGDFAGIGRHKARNVLRTMAAAGRVEHFRVEQETYWRAL